MRARQPAVSAGRLQEARRSCVVVPLQGLRHALAAPLLGRTLDDILKSNAFIHNAERGTYTAADPVPSLQAHD